MKAITETITEQHANGGVTGSGVLAAATWIVDLAPVLQVVATFAAIVVAAIAGWYKIEQIREIRRNRKD